MAFVDDHFMAVGSSGAALISMDGVEWSSVELPTSESLRGIASGDGTTIVTGDAGTLLRTAHGGGWEVVPAHTEAFLLSATFADGRFVVVGEWGTILVSSNGAQTFEFASVDFKESPLDLPNHLFGVTHGKGQFIAVGRTIVTSSDAYSWATPCFDAEEDCAAPAE